MSTCSLIYPFSISSLSISFSSFAPLHSTSISRSFARSLLLYCNFTNLFFHHFPLSVEVIQRKWNFSTEKIRESSEHMHTSSCEWIISSLFFISVLGSYDNDDNVNNNKTSPTSQSASQPSQ